jgi:hypothetical protein
MLAIRRGGTMRPAIQRTVAPVLALGVAAALASAAPGKPLPAAPAPTHQVGFAARAITPTLAGRPVYLAGFDNDRRASGVHDELWARAFAVSDGRRRIVLVAVDLIGVFHADVCRARERLERRVPGATLVVASTHVHEGPDTMGLWGPGRFTSGVDRAYLDGVLQAIADVAAEALARLEPARFVIASARTPGLVEDGRLPRVIDDRIVVLQALGASGRTLGTLVEWSSHPEALGGRNTLVTSDYPHFLRARVEARLGGTCVFVAGAIGGLMTPLGVRLSDAAGRPIPPDSFALAQAVGERAADAALAALRDTPHPSVSPALDERSATVFLPLENRLFRLAALLGVMERPLFTRGARASTLFGDDLRSEVGFLRLGELEALLVPGEIYPELVQGGIQQPQDPAADFPGAARERPLVELFRSDYRMVVGLANDEVGYLIPRSQWDARAPFAYGRQEAQYGEVNSLGPATAARLADAFARMLER